MIEEGTALSVRVGGGSPAWNDEDVEAARMIGDAHVCLAALQLYPFVFL